MNPYLSFQRWWNNKTETEKHWTLFLAWNDFGHTCLIGMLFSWRYLEEPWWSFVFLSFLIVFSVWKGNNHEVYLKNRLGMVKR